MLVYFTISLAVLLGCCGMAIDVGRMELRTTQLQAAADDGALTAAAELQRGSSNSNTSTLVQSEVSAFLTLAGLPSATAVFQYVASTGSYANDYSAIQVTVTQTLPLNFMALVGQTSRTITTRAVALLPPCVFFRDNTLLPPTQNARLASAGFRASCPVYAVRNFVNDAFSYAGYNQLKVTGTAAQSNSTGSFSAPPIYNTPALADPLAYITAPPSPTAITCNHFIAVTLLVPTTISPGNYCGGLIITATNVTMLPGLYVVTGPVLITAGSVITGTGVTMYLTKGAGFNYGPFSLTASTWNASAPTDASAGGIPGIVLFGDRNWVGGQYDFTLNGGTFQADGIIYTTNTGISSQGSNMNSGGHYFGLDVASLYEYTGNINPTCDYSPLPGGNPFHIPVRLLQ